MLFSLGGPTQTVCSVYVCDLTFCVSLVVHLGRLRVTVSEFEASRGGCFPQRPPIPAHHATVHSFFSFLNHSIGSWHELYNPLTVFDELYWKALQWAVVFVLRHRSGHSAACFLSPFLFWFPLFFQQLFSESIHHAGWDERLIEREGIGLNKLSTDFILRSFGLMLSYRFFTAVRILLLLLSYLRAQMH